MNKKPLFLITMGDPAGIGAEVIVKSLSKNVFDAKLIVVGDKACINEAIKFCKLNLKINLMKNINDKYYNKTNVINLISLSKLEENKIFYKTNSALYGDCAFKYLTWSINKCLKKEADGIVTGPINKESLFMANHRFAGHTEILAKYTKTSRFGMLLKSKHLNVIHVTTHCALKDVSKEITKEKILSKIILLNDALKLLGYKNPKIAVAGLNPHSSDNGRFGNEEKFKIIPAIKEANKMSINATGPYSPDTVFVRSIGGEFDGVVAMYHDQGHIAVKLDGFKYNYKTNTYTSLSGINCTIGLPFIRTSVDHGTAFGKAGEGRANEDSMNDAIKCAIRMFNNK